MAATGMNVERALQLADWRRRVAEMYANWRGASIDDPRAATDALRATRDEIFRDHPQSPIPGPERARFGGLSYWAYDPRLPNDGHSRGPD